MDDSAATWQCQAFEQDQGKTFAPRDFPHNTDSAIIEERLLQIARIYMTVRTITVTLPETVYEQLETEARITAHAFAPLQRRGYSLPSLDELRTRSS
jgi:hypothetical protein